MKTIVSAQYGDDTLQPHYGADYLSIPCMDTECLVNSYVPKRKPTIGELIN